MARCGSGRPPDRALPPRGIPTRSAGTPEPAGRSRVAEDGTRVFSLGWSAPRAIRIWDPVTGRLDSVEQCGGSVFGVFPSGNRIALIEHGGLEATGIVIRDLRAEPSDPLPSRGFRAGVVTSRRTGRLVGRRRIDRKLDAAERAERVECDDRRPSPHPNRARHVRAAPDGPTRTGRGSRRRSVTAPDAVGEIVIWDAQTRRPAVRAARAAAQTCARWRPATTGRGSSRVTGTGGSTTRSGRWPSGTPRRARCGIVSSGRCAAATSFAIAPDDSWLVSGHGEWNALQRRPGEIGVWDPHRRDAARLRLRRPRCRRGRLAGRDPARGHAWTGPLAGDGGEIRVWSTDGWRPLAALRVAGTVEPVVWAKDIVVAGGDRGVYCLRLRDA